MLHAVRDRCDEGEPAVKPPEHLAHLPTWRGLPVPYVNRWGTEVAYRYIGDGPEFPAACGVRGR